MKRFVLLAVLIALVFVGYRVYTYQPPPERRRAPVGTFFLTRYVSSQTPTGVVGLTPGEEVRLVPGIAQSSNNRIVTDGVHQFEVDQASLTDDLDLAEQLGGTDKDRQKKAATKVLEEKAAADHAKRQRDLDMAKKAEADLEAYRRNTIQPHP